MKLDFQPIINHPDLVHDSMYKFMEKHHLIDQFKVARIDPKYANDPRLDDVYEVDPYLRLKCIVFMGVRRKVDKYAAVVVQNPYKVDSGSLLHHAMDVSKVSFGNLDDVIKQTDMEFGSITPVGVPEFYQILIDSRVKKIPDVILGSGQVNSKLMTTLQALESLPNARYVDGLAKED